MKCFVGFLYPNSYTRTRVDNLNTNWYLKCAKVLKICKTHTTLYHPKGDGLVERFNRTLMGMLATAIADHSLDWDKCLPKVCFAYNTG